MPLVDVHNPLHRALDLEEAVHWHDKAEAPRVRGLQESDRREKMYRCAIERVDDDTGIDDQQLRWISRDSVLREHRCRNQQACGQILTQSNS